jgi:hypothetical protein
MEDLTLMDSLEDLTLMDSLMESPRDTACALQKIVRKLERRLHVGRPYRLYGLDGSEAALEETGGVIRWGASCSRSRCVGEMGDLTPLLTFDPIADF